MKRQDLQGIRGVAILLVIAFHLQPSRFPLGFVGVDIFFVLSGFLMTLVLSKDVEHSYYELLRNFFSRRFQRIVPVYHVCLLGVFASCAFLLTASDKEQLVLDLKWCLPFFSNIQPFYEAKGYWDQITSFRFLTHCWSLAVEVQFYLLAPFIITAINRLPHKFRFFILSVLILTSAIFQLVASTNVSYDLLPSRIWQFLMGTLCFRTNEGTSSEEVAASLTEKEKLLDQEANDLEPLSSFSTPSITMSSNKWSHLLTSEAALGLLVVIVAVNPPFLSEKLIRIIGCLAACLVIFYPAPRIFSVLSNRFLVYVGDLSYAMYLIHWPIIVAARYYYNLEVLQITETCMLTAVIFLVTIVFHVIIEKPLVSGGICKGILISLSCVVLICLLGSHYINCCSNLRATSFDYPNKEINISEAIEYNTNVWDQPYYKILCDEDTVTPTWTNYTGQETHRCQTYSNGTLKILVFGNSIAFKAFPLVKEVLNGNYKELRLFSKSSSPPLSNWNPMFTAATHIVVDKMRPDIIWNIHNAFDDYFIRPFVDKAKDEAFLDYQKNLDYYTARTKAFIIDLPYYRAEMTPYIVCNEIARRLSLGLPIDDSFKVAKAEAIKQQIHHRARLLALNCTMCSYNAVEDLLWEGDAFWFYNRKNLHCYTREGHHFTPEFLKRLKPLYTKAIDETFRRLNVSRTSL